MSTTHLAAVDFGQGLSSAWSSIANFVPKFVAFLVIMVIGWFIAKAIAKVVGVVLNKVGFNRLVERGGIKDMLAKSKYDATDIIAKIVYYAILLIALQLAFGVFGPNPISTMLTAIVAWLPRAIVAIVIVVVAAAIANAVKDMVGNMLGGLSYGKVLATIAAVFIWGLGIIAALNQMGIGTTVTMPVLVTVLATVGGVIIVGMGGGLIKPMQQRWEKWLGRAESELPASKAQNQAYQRGREDATRGSEPETEQLRMPHTPMGAGAEGQGSMGGATRRPGSEGPGPMPPTGGQG
ncbi:hypothetical protein FPZ12_010665 [Amycolatopsis acidicola]|uniref:Mechanosensitive ion channel n=1 Tax=Amycolatopsis acidicola TaxID=2596893 RepID=A0A5N0VCB4_9PSEU|nr:hypothetical protein [Amycolatopsis acidicola]KAA9162963.1 hypothetical protein FPZ12_010665 [Amycolatopsis acidicola]